jgi:hypothetical protein
MHATANSIVACCSVLNAIRASIQQSTQTLHALSSALHCNTDITGANLVVNHYTTESAAMFLATQTRDASVSGPALREVHREVGRYLTYKLLDVVRLLLHTTYISQLLTDTHSCSACSYTCLAICMLQQAVDTYCSSCCAQQYLIIELCAHLTCLYATRGITLCTCVLVADSIDHVHCAAYLLLLL